MKTTFPTNTWIRINSQVRLFRFPSKQLVQASASRTTTGWYVRGTTASAMAIRRSCWLKTRRRAGFHSPELSSVVAPCAALTRPGWICAICTLNFEPWRTRFSRMGRIVTLGKFRKQAFEGNDVTREVSFLRGAFEIFQFRGLIESEFAHRRADNFGEVRAAAEGRAHVVGERADVGAGGAFDRNFRQRAGNFVARENRRLRSPPPSVPPVFSCARVRAPGGREFSSRNRAAAFAENGRRARRRGARFLRDRFAVPRPDRAARHRRRRCPWQSRSGTWSRSACGAPRKIARAGWRARAAAPERRSPADRACRGGRFAGSRRCGARLRPRRATSCRAACR